MTKQRTYTFITRKRQYINAAVKYLLDYDYPFSFSVKDKGTFINLNLKVKFDSQDKAELLWRRLNEVAGNQSAFSLCHRR